MKAHLLHRDRDLDLEAELPGHTESLEQDVELGSVLDAMARGDELVRKIAERVLLLGLTDPAEIRYRQAVVADCVAQPELTRRLYDLAVDAIESRRRAQVFWFQDSPEALLSKSLRMLELLVGSIGELRRIADENVRTFRSAGMQTLVATLRRELDDEYLAEVDSHLKRLQFKRGTLISAELGRANRGTSYVLRKAPDRGFFERLTGARDGLSFTIPPRDEHGAEAVSDLRDRGLRLVAAALAQATDHILEFFGMLRVELAFYLGCVNLHEELEQRGWPVAYPEPCPSGDRRFSACGLYDIALALHLQGGIVGNDVDANGRRLIVITGANQGGKSTFLRSVGLAQLMLQAGMFVGARSLEASVASGVFTHFKREEDETMTSGKLDEELVRMQQIAARIRPGGLLLANEPFAATNEQEGSEIGRQVVRAMSEAGVRVFLVTHLFDLAHGLFRDDGDRTVFLRAERTSDGVRTFRIRPGEPLPTSFGEDSYRRIFGGEVGATAG